MAACDPEHVRAWQRLDARTTTSGRIEAGDVPLLAAIGVAHVINLALADHPEALADEGEVLARHGIGYTHIPVPFDAPGDAHYAAFRAAIEAARGPVHVHCIMNWRVSAFFYRLHRELSTMPEPAARALMEQQWSPDTSDDPRAAPWAAFIAAGRMP
jgi:protein tyrosine phosphatase (PTP) superfamily phosphohydrolase (DUF442 family)